MSCLTFVIINNLHANVRPIFLFFSVQCEHCEKPFAKKGGYLYRHVRKVHKIRLYKRDPVTQAVDLKFQCGECAQMFNNKGSLYNHLKKKHPSLVRSYTASSARNENEDRVTEEATNSIIVSESNFNAI